MKTRSISRDNESPSGSVSPESPLRNDFGGVFDFVLSRQKCNMGPGVLDPNASSLSTSEPGTQWRIWQLADSAFPTGGFAHSSGLESAWQQGEVRSLEELADFIRVHLSQTGRAMLPFVNEAYHQSQPFADLDRLYDVFVSNHVANRGSRSQGQAFLLAAAQSFNLPSLIRLRTDLFREKLPGHFAPVFGSVLRLLKISHWLCLRLFLFMSLRSLLASAVRLGIAGPMAAQSLQSRLECDAEKVACRACTARVAEAAQTSPLLDILHGAHDRLYSRLFQT